MNALGKIGSLGIFISSIAQNILEREFDHYWTYSFRLPASQGMPSVGLETTTLGRRVSECEASSNGGAKRRVCAADRILLAGVGINRGSDAKGATRTLWEPSLVLRFAGKRPTSAPRSLFAL